MNERLAFLFNKHYDKTISAEEKAELFSMLEGDSSDEEVKELIGKSYYGTRALDTMPREQAEAVLQAILRANDQDTRRPAHRVHFLRTAWVRYAAAIIIILGTGAYLWHIRTKERPSDATTIIDPVPVQNDVVPGGNKAMLTLADGSRIVLDSARNGELAREANATIIKTAEGKIVYTAGGSADGHMLYNTMTTPRGGQYQLTLPDGSQVWLNAESSITYPTAFTGKERNVSITGEVYFEVAKNKAQPFRVNAGEQMIEVLGTHFNVNSYKDEPTINTTLLEGSVRIKTVHTSLTLKPGQQGRWDPGKENLSLAVHADVEQAVAWKNGVFNFNNVLLEEAMRQISRWYDVEVVFASGVPKTTFGGKMGRDLRLSQVLKLLEEMGVKFRIEGKKIIVQ